MAWNKFHQVQCAILVVDSLCISRFTRYRDHLHISPMSEFYFFDNDPLNREVFYPELHANGQEEVGERFQWTITDVRGITACNRQGAWNH